MTPHSEFADPAAVIPPRAGTPKWRATFGDEAWKMLEKYAGPLV